MKIKQILKKMMVGVVALALAAFNIMMVGGVPAMALGCVNEKTGVWEDPCTSKADKKVSNFVGNGIKLFLGIIAILAVLYVIYGGMKYTTSAGDPGKVKQAQNTIFYGLLGLVISLLAFAIVDFVVGKLVK